MKETFRFLKSVNIQSLNELCGRVQKPKPSEKHAHITFIPSLTKVIMEFWIFTNGFSSIINSQNQRKATNTEIK